ncbi:hypothetical protein Tco_0411523 [Tanacetum coccineum]
MVTKLLLFIPCDLPKFSVCQYEGFYNIKITYLGGMWVLFLMDTLDSKDKLLNHTGVNSWFSTIKEACNSFVCDERITWVSIEGLPIKAWTPSSFRKIASLSGEIVEWEDSDSFTLSSKPLCLKMKIDDYINEQQKFIIQGKVYWIRAKELYAWTPSFVEDKHDTSSSADESEDIIGENFVGNNDKIDSRYIDRVSESSFSHVNDYAHNTSEVPNNVPVAAKPHSEDPFNIYGILNKQHKKASNSSTTDPKFPPGFTPVNSNGANEQVQSLSSGSILEVLDEIVKVGQTMGYNMEGCVKNIEAIIGRIGIFPLTTLEPEKRLSKNRVAGTLEIKPILSVTKDVTRSWLLQKVLPAIRARWTQGHMGPIYIQQDNAKPHIGVDDAEFLQEASQDGFDIRIRFQPPNSPDLNVLDLGFFRAI